MRRQGARRRDRCAKSLLERLAAPRGYEPKAIAFTVFTSGNVNVGVLALANGGV